MADVRYVITVDSTGAQKAVETFDQALDRLGKTTTTTKAGVRTFGDEFIKNLVPSFTIATLAADAIRKSFGLVKDGIKDTIDAAIEAERADRALEATVDIVGQAAGGTAKKIKDYANALMQQTLYDDEAIKSAQALIIQMRGTTDQLDRATKGAIGLASVFQMDLQSAARAVASGFEGNYRQLGMLIPAVRQATTEGEKHAAMMKALGDYYKRAESETQTFGGQISQIKKVFNETLEVLGSFVTKNETVLNSLAGLKEIIAWLSRESASFEGKKSIFDKLITNTPALNAILDTLRIAQAKATVENVKYATSWEGVTAAIFAARKTALDPIPEKMLVISKTVDKAGQDFIAFTRAIQVAHSAAKTIDPIPFKLVGDVIENDVLFPLTKLPKATRDWVEILKTIPGVTIAPFKEIKLNFEAIMRSAQDVMSSFDAIISQGQRNREIGIENEYKKRLAAINANVKDETARQKAIVALEAEFQIKKTAAAAAGAKQAKAVAMMEAVVNTASAVVSALKVFPPWLGIAFASVIGALGAVQIGLIAKQPLPLAKGAYFPKPTLLPAVGRDVLVGDTPGEGEIVAPESAIVRAVQRAFTLTPQMAFAGAGASVTVNINSPLVTTSGLADSDLERAGGKLMEVIRGRLRFGDKF